MTALLSQEAVDKKKVSFTEEQLNELYKHGSLLSVRALRRKEIRHLYYKWLKDDSDTRTFEEIYAKRVEDHINFWNKQLGIALKDFVPEVIGTATLASNVEYDILTVTSEYHEKLAIMVGKQSTRELYAWVKFKLLCYCDEYTVAIDYEQLVQTGIAKIETAVLL